MLDDKMLASAQYNDLKGNVAIDGHEGPNLSEFARKHGIDTNKYLPIGISIFKAGDFEIVSICTVSFALNRNDLKQYIAQNSGPIPIKRFNLDGVTLNDYLESTKRFNFLAVVDEKLMGRDIYLE